MKTNFLKLIFLSSITAIIIIAPVFAVVVSAQDIGIEYADDLGLSDGGGGDIRVFIVNIVKYLLTFLGIIAVVMIMYGGFVWMTANGEADRVLKAKRILISAVIGLIIVLAAFTIVTFVVNFTTDTLSGRCSPGDSGNCGCQNIGVRICQPDGSWGSCSGDCNYSGGERCCAWGCDVNCLIPPSFDFIGSIPADGATNVIRNIEISYNFNRTVDSSVFIDSMFTVEDIDTGVAIAGSRTTSGKKIIFSPAAGCGINECGATNCFASGQRVRVEAIDGAGGILSVGGIELNCPMGSGCLIEFMVGDLIDCDTPKAKLDFSQVCAADNNELYAFASDNSGISQLEFFVEGISINDPDNPRLFTGEPSVNTRNLGQPLFWDASAFSVNTPLKLKVSATDVSGKIGSDERTYRLRPEHCCNGILDGDETGVDCGGSCAACEGAACGISLYQACSGIDDQNCDNSLCASDMCVCSDLGAEECSSAGYSAGISSCCVCQAAPIIDYVSPIGGFCIANPNVYCGDDDSVCDVMSVGDTCDKTTANASAGSLLTIGGRYFGAYVPGISKVEFNNISANLAETVNPNCIGSWQDNQIIVVLPSGLPENPIIKVTAGSGNFDTSGADGRGSEINFRVNNISRPGLCLINPDSGVFQDEISFQGLSLNGASAFFGNYQQNMPALNSAFNSALSGSAAVPNISKTGRVTVFVKNPGLVNSNYLNFIKEKEAEIGPYILSFSPLSGPGGQYITITGGGFGGSQGSSKVYFDQNPGDNTSGNPADYGIEADMSFPSVCAANVWSDNQIIVKAPQGLVNGNYYLVLDLSGKGLIDSSQTFHTGPLANPTFGFDSALPLAPSLCRIDPVLGRNNSEVSLFGEYFGTYETGGASKVRFYNAKEQSGPLSPLGIISWERVSNYDKIRVVVHSEAITGPVSVVKNNTLAGNSLNFTIGECTKNSDCNKGEEAGFCCPAGSAAAGRCAVDDNGDGKADALDCYVALSSSVYEWQFTTGSAGGGIGDPCKDSTTPTCPENPGCADGLICDSSSCTCQMSCDSDVTNATCDADNDMCSSQGVDWVCNPGTCFCENIKDPTDSCRGVARRTNSCDPDPCPNSAGFCSPFAGGEKIYSGDICNNDSCTMPGCTPLTCSYNASINKCTYNDSFCSKPVSDITGKTASAYCASYNSENRWHFNTPQSCPEGWFKIVDNKCVAEGDAGICSPCELGLNCVDTNGDGNGECISDFNICPSGYACEGEQCAKGGTAECECCCRIGFNAQDCCLGLNCAGDCGSDRENDTDTKGYCTECRVEVGGVVDQNASDAACNCEGVGGKYCDVDYEVNGVKVGACKDCSELSASPSDCSIHPTACCVDGKNGNDCRGIGGGSAFESGLFNYCAYYDCALPNEDSCDSGMKISGAYKTFDVCDKSCVGNSSSGLGLSCASSRSDSCNTGICLNPFGCLNENGSGPVFPSSCGVCCCDPSRTGANDQCALAGLDLKCVADNAPCDGSGRGLCCGCSFDTDCSVGSPDAVGCGSDSCCRARPNVNSSAPTDEADKICRNTQIEVIFDQKMDIKSFNGNVILIGDYGFDLCPEGTEYLAAAGHKPAGGNFLSRAYLKTFFTLKRILSRLPVTDKVFAYEPIGFGHNFCAVRGQSSGYNGADDRGVLIFKPRILLDTDRLYYVIIKGDHNLIDAISQGAKSIYGIGMNGGMNGTFNGVNYNNSHIFSFRTLDKQANNNGVCTIDYVEIKPSSYLFQSNRNDPNDDNENSATYDTIADSDKVFIAYAKNIGGQSLSPIPGVYDWTINWNIDNPDVADFVLPNPSDVNQRLIRASEKKTEGETALRANATVGANTIEAPEPTAGKADIYLFVCNNPWPPLKADGTWSPWHDAASNCTIFDQGCSYGYNFKLYYCRDAGKPGTYDDLPAIYSGDGTGTGNAVIRGESGILVCSLNGEFCPSGASVGAPCGFEGKGKCQRNFLKEIYFFREISPIATTSISVVNGEDGNSAIIFWNRIASGVDGYKLYWGNRSMNYLDYAEVYNDGNDDHAALDCDIDAAGLISCRLNGLTNNTTYYFNLTSFLDTGSESSHFGEKSVLISDVALPDAPANLRAISGDRQAILSWDPVSDAAGYRVYYGVNSGVYGGSEDVGNDTGVALRGLTNGKTYYFVVTAYDQSNNESWHSLERSVVPAAADCGDGICSAASECASCGTDCSVSDCCGNGNCDIAAGETLQNCPSDCSSNPLLPPPPSSPAICGDGNCDSGECMSGCSADCGISDCCGIEGCNAGIGENETNCNIDCGGIMPPPPPPPPPAE